MTINNSYKGSKQNYIQSITGPQLISVSGSIVTNHEKFPTLVLSGGLKLDTNLKNRYHTLSVDVGYIEKAISGSDYNGTYIESDDGKVRVGTEDIADTVVFNFDGTTHYQFTNSSINYQLVTGSRYVGNAQIMADGFAIDGFIANGNPVVSRWTSAEADISGNFINGGYAIAGGPYSFFGDTPPTSYGVFFRDENAGTSRFTLKSKAQGLDTQRAEIEGYIDDTTGKSYVEFDVSGSNGKQNLRLADDSGLVVTASNVEIINRATSNKIPVFDGTYTGLPSGMPSIVGGLHILSSSISAPPDLEWWDPVWTPSSANISSVNNIECQYTRVYRAAGGSLVTLEGTLRVEITNDSAFTIFTTPLPVPATGTGSLRAGGICTAANRSDRSMVRITISGTGSERNLSISAPPLLDATGVSATLTIGFRISYRAV